jgi:general secretion pathway protein N
MTVVRLRPTPGKGRPGTTSPPLEGQVRMLRQQRRLALVGAVVGLVVGVIAFLPASLVANAVASATGDQFLLAEAQGTVWNGSALAVLTSGKDGHDASVLPTRLEWRLRPRLNGIALHLAQDCCIAHGVDLSLRRGLKSWDVEVVGPGEGAAPAEPAAPGTPPLPRVGAGTSDAIALANATPLGQWPMGWLEGRGFPWNTIHPGGLLTLTTRHLSFSYRDGHWRTLGSAQIEIRQASSRLTSLDTLGSYRVLIQPDASTQLNPGEGASRSLVWISTQEGALLIDGRGLIGATGLRLRAEAHAGAGFEAVLNNLLNLIGRRNGALSVISIG